MELPGSGLSVSVPIHVDGHIPVVFSYSKNGRFLIGNFSPVTAEATVALNIFIWVRIKVSVKRMVLFSANSIIAPA